ncbi:hypothetical protein HOD38_06005 [archaeon]|jgi:hypothetical protein|nr:hypothetical protein [archaeon]MBT4397792.1 hypothetical protein [archaeon]MBT4441126.1 hypothetical protein [archaeon]
MKKIILSTIFILIISFGMVAAEFSAQAGYDWLTLQGGSTGFGGDIFATSLAVMALDEGGYDTTGYEDWLYTQMNSDYCFGGTTCTTTDTSAAVLALAEVQDDTYFDEIESWFAGNVQGATFSGDWALEISTSATGTCTFTYDLLNITQSLDIEVDAGTFPACSDSNFLDLDTCLQSNLIKNNPGLTFEVDCSALEGDVIMTLLYKSATTYYLLDNQNTDVAEFTVTNGCFGSGGTGSCDKESSLYANWALKLMGSDTNSIIYLKENYDDSNALDVAIMYKITGDSTFLSTLADQQKTDGSFDRNVYRTSIAVLALKDYESEYSDVIDNAKAWLREQQASDGDWNANVEDTAMTLYGAFSDEGVSAASCSDGVQNQGEEGVDCGGPCTSCSGGAEECASDVDCEIWGSGYQCTSGQCIYYGTSGCVDDTECDTGEACIEGYCMETDCNSDGICDFGVTNENSQHCPSDCYCGDNVYDDYEQVYGCSLDEPEEEVPEDECYSNSDCANGYECIFGECVVEDTSGGGGIWVFLIIILILGALGGGGFFLWKKGYLGPIIDKVKSKLGKKPPGGPSFSPPPGPRPGMPPGAPGMRPPARQPPLQRSVQQARQPPFRR